MFEYEVSIPYILIFKIGSEKKLTRAKLLQKCHEEGCGSASCYDDDKAEIISGELQEA